MSIEEAVERFARAVPWLVLAVVPAVRAHRVARRFSPSDAWFWALLVYLLWLAGAWFVRPVAAVVSMLTCVAWLFVWLVQLSAWLLKVRAKRRSSFRG